MADRLTDLATRRERTQPWLGLARTQPGSTARTAPRSCHRRRSPRTSGRATHVQASPKCAGSDAGRVRRRNPPQRSGRRSVQRSASPASNEAGTPARSAAAGGEGEREAGGLSSAVSTPGRVPAPLARSFRTGLTVADPTARYRQSGSPSFRPPSRARRVRPALLLARIGGQQCPGCGRMSRATVQPAANKTAAATTIAMIRRSTKFSYPIAHCAGRVAA